MGFAFIAILALLHEMEVWRELLNLGFYGSADKVDGVDGVGVGSWSCGGGDGEDAVKKEGLEKMHGDIG